MSRQAHACDADGRCGPQRRVRDRDNAAGNGHGDAHYSPALNAYSGKHFVYSDCDK